MCKEKVEQRGVFLEGFSVGVSSRIEALEKKVAELSTSNNKQMVQLPPLEVTQSLFADEHGDPKNDTIMFDIKIAYEFIIGRQQNHL